jgi:hypothetical protein
MRIAKALHFALGFGKNPALSRKQRGTRTGHPRAAVGMTDLWRGAGLPISTGFDKI